MIGPIAAGDESGENVMVTPASTAEAVNKSLSTSETMSVIFWERRTGGDAAVSTVKY